MSDILEVTKKYAPDCACFQDDSGYAMRVAMSVTIGQHFATGIMKTCDEYGFCRAALPHVLDDVILNATTIIAISGTIIECGSVEAERELVRVLTGIESRLIEKVRAAHAGAREEIEAGRMPRVDGRGNEVKS
jgi:hypothetical protein